MGTIQNILIGSVLFCTVIIAFVFAFVPMFANPVYDTDFNSSKFAVYNNTINEFTNSSQNKFNSLQNLSSGSSTGALLEWIDFFAGSVWSTFKLIFGALPITIANLLGFTATELNIPLFIIGIIVAIITFIIIFEIISIFMKRDI